MSRYIHHHHYLAGSILCLFIIILFNLISDSDAAKNIVKTNFFFNLNRTNIIEEPTYSPGYFIKGTNFGGFLTIDNGYAVGFDSYKNVYIGGQYNGRPSLYKMDNDGNTIFTYIPSGGGGGEIKRIAIDSNGNIFITGNFISTLNFGGGSLSTGDNGGYDIFIVKLDAEGRHIWSKRFGGQMFSSTPTESGNGLSIDPTDNSIILFALFGDGGAVDFGGGFVKPFYSQDSIIVKLSNDGNFIWNRHIGGSAGTYPSDVTVDKMGNVYVTGYFYSPTKFDTNLIVTNNAGINPDTFIAKYSVNNVFQWVKNYGQQTTQCGGRGLVVDNNGDLVFLGYSIGINNFGGLMLTNRGADDIILAKYNSYNGNHIWSKSIGSWNLDYARGIGIDAANRITIAGIFNKSLNFSDGNILNVSDPSINIQSFVANFEEDGRLLWARCFGNGTQRLEAVAIRPDGRIYTVGRTSGMVYFDDFNLYTQYYSDILFLEIAEQSKINVK